jgi:hypothetical protein
MVGMSRESSMYACGLASRTTAVGSVGPTQQVLTVTAHQTLQKTAEEDATGICMYGRIEKPAGPQNAEGGTGGGRAVYESPSGASMASAPARGSRAMPSYCARCGPCGDTRSRRRTR